MKIDASTAATSGLVNGIQSTQIVTGSSVTTSAIQGVYGLASFANTTVSNGSTAIGLDGYAANSSTGTLGEAKGVKGNIENQTTETINFAAAGAVTVTQTAGTIVNARGIEIGTIQGTTKHSVYASDSTAPSYFAGSVGIGTLSPQATLDVNGSAAYAVATVSLTADNQLVTVTGRSIILLTSDNATATNRTYCIGAGATGQVITLVWNTANGGELIDGAQSCGSAAAINMSSTLSTAAGSGIDDFIQLMYTGSKWIEISSANN